MNPEAIKGVGITAHPINGATRYRKVATSLAVQVWYGGTIETPEGVMEFHAGDYIVTDDPPTHAWPVKREVFDRTHRPDDSRLDSQESSTRT